MGNNFRYSTVDVVLDSRIRLEFYSPNGLDNRMVWVPSVNDDGYDYRELKCTVCMAGF